MDTTVHPPPSVTRSQYTPKPGRPPGEIVNGPLVAPGIIACTSRQLPGEHVPAAHTPLVHTVPSGTLVPLSMQTGAPVAHETVPVWQGLDERHAGPAVQPTHVPAALHTRFSPHAVPG